MTQQAREHEDTDDYRELGHGAEDVVDDVEAGDEDVGGGDIAADADEGGEHETTTEDRARAMGWRPKEEFRGNPDQWRDADEFVRVSEEELPVLRERNRRLQEQVASDARAREAQADQISRMERMSALGLKRQREQIQEEYRQAKLEAVDIGDIQAYQNIEQQERQALGDFDEDLNSVVEPKGGQDGGNPPTVDQDKRQETVDFVQRNPWFNSDPELHQTACAISNIVGDANPNMSLGDVLAETERRVKMMHPERFPAAPARRQRASPVEGGGGRRAASQRTGHGVSKLPPEVRKQGQAFVDEGLYKNLDEYAKDYNAMEG